MGHKINYKIIVNYSMVCAFQKWVTKCLQNYGECFSVVSDFQTWATKYLPNYGEFLSKSLFGKLDLEKF